MPHFHLHGPHLDSDFVNEEEWVTRSKNDFEELFRRLQLDYPTLVLGRVKMDGDYIRLWLQFLLRHEIFRHDRILAAFLTAPKSFLVACKEVKNVPAPITVPPELLQPQNWFSTFWRPQQTPIDSRYRRIEKQAGRLKRLAKRLKRVVQVLDELLASHSKAHQESSKANLALKALFPHLSLKQAPSSLPAVILQTRFLIDYLQSVKDLVRRCNAFRKSLYSRRLELARFTSQLEVAQETSGKLDFDRMYRLQQARDQMAGQVDALAKLYEEFGELSIIELKRIQIILQADLPKLLARLFQ